MPPIKTSDKLEPNWLTGCIREFSVGAMTDRWLGIFPPPPKSGITWPEQWTIKPILVAQNQWHFSPPMRVFRRMLVKFRR